MTRAELLRVGLRKIQTSGADESRAVDPVQLAVQALALRRRRARFLKDIHFGEPVWDILLDLFVHEALGSAITISSACYGSGVPVTTGLRHLKKLEDAGLVEREADSRDGRKFYVRLTALASEQLARLLAGDK